MGAGGDVTTAFYSRGNCAGSSTGALRPAPRGRSENRMRATSSVVVLSSLLTAAVAVAAPDEKKAPGSTALPAKTPAAKAPAAKAPATPPAKAPAAPAAP